MAPAHPDIRPPKPASQMISLFDWTAVWNIDSGKGACPDGWKQQKPEETIAHTTHNPHGSMHATSPGSIQSWGSGGHTLSAPASRQQCQFHSGRQGAQAENDAGPSLSPLSPGSSVPVTAPPDSHSTQGARPGLSQHLRSGE